MSVSYLIGDNQYQLENGEKKDAEISVQFIKLPKILFIQLKRFDFNFEAQNMEKLNKKLGNVDENNFGA